MRFTGPLFKHFEGDPAAAAAYLSRARVLMARLKARLALGGLAGGVGVQQERLPNGVIIRVEQIGGVHKTTISVPYTPVLEVEEPVVVIPVGFGCLARGRWWVIGWDAQDERWEDPQPVQAYGNVDWQGPQDAVLSWWGLPSRYFDATVPALSSLPELWPGAIYHREIQIGGFHGILYTYHRIDERGLETDLFQPYIYSGGRVIYEAEGQVRGAALTTHEGRQWLVYVSGGGASDTLYAVPLGEPADRAIRLASVRYDLIEQPGQGVQTYEVQPNLSVWAFSRSGRKAVAMRFHQGRYYKWTAALEFDDGEGEPRGTFVQGPAANQISRSVAPQEPAYDQIGPFFTYRIGSTSLQVFYEEEFDRPYFFRTAGRSGLTGSVTGTQYLAFDFRGEEEVSARVEVSGAESGASSMSATVEQYTFGYNLTTQAPAQLRRYTALQGQSSHQGSITERLYIGPRLAASATRRRSIERLASIGPGAPGETIAQATETIRQDPSTAWRLQHLDLRTGVLVHQEVASSAQRQSRQYVGDSGADVLVSTHITDPWRTDITQALRRIGVFTDALDSARIDVPGSSGPAGDFGAGLSLDDHPDVHTFSVESSMLGTKAAQFVPAVFPGAAASSRLGAILSLALHETALAGVDLDQQGETWRQHRRFANRLYRPDGEKTDIIPLFPPPDEAAGRGVIDIVVPVGVI